MYSMEGLNVINVHRESCIVMYCGTSEYHKFETPVLGSSFKRDH